jgi:predicted O-linked N-acetylglucosamine transferase (SPINDLY family)
VTTELAPIYGLLNAGRWQEGEAALRRLLRRAPGLVDGWFALGIAAYQLGRPAGALAAFRRGLALAPEIPALWSNLGMAALRQPAAVTATRYFERALALDPGFVDALTNLATLATRVRDWPVAVRLYHRAAALAPAGQAVWAGAADLAVAEAAMPRGVTCFTRARRMGPLPPAAHSGLVYSLQFLDAVPAAANAAARDYAAAHAVPLAPAKPGFRVRRDPGKRLRIGYVSPDFRAHSCAYFLEPLFAAHDRAAVEVVAYADLPRPDAVSARLRALADRWVPVTGQDDAAVAARIRDDRIDVLVDLAGHTADNRLLVFARKPAPIQLTWLGYAATTGLTAIDGRVADDWLVPADSAEWFSEAVLRLPRVSHCYRPPEGLPAPSPAPCEAHGFVTFGCFNGLGKLSDATVARWCEILRAAPETRLVLKARATAIERVRARFTARGVAAERIDFAPWAEDQPTQFAQHGLFDLGLDPWPYNGTTTTCEALWMGVPVLTLRGDRLLARMGTSLLAQLGLDDLIAVSEADYVAKAVALAREPARLADWRRGLRARMAASPLGDETGFARAMEALYRAAWRRWCAAATTGA